MVLKTSEYERNPLDYARYHKPNKQIKQEFQLNRLKQEYEDEKLSFS
jgi:hypothetical protein